MKRCHLLAGSLLAMLGLFPACAGSGAPPSGSGGSGGGQGGAMDAPPAPDSGEAAGEAGGPVDVWTDEAGLPHAGKWQIMPLGDSITGTTCYPKLLAQKLVESGHADFTFIGTVLNNQSCWSAPNVQTEGHGYYYVTYLTTDSPPEYGKGKLGELLAWAAQKPEIVLMEYGTNDVWDGVATSEILDAYSFVIDAFRQQNPSVIFFVAQITPLNPTDCPECEANVEALNAAIPAWAASENTAASPVYVADIWSALQPASAYVPKSPDTLDGCHPTPAGAQKMADKWYEVLLAKGIP
jgi:lysophospholipase L1-like esterase